MARSRRTRRGATTLETMWIIVIFTIPMVSILSAWGVKSLAEYRSARSYMLQSFP